MANITNIPPARIPIIDSRTGFITREWYMFFLNIFTLTGGGTTDITLDDLQIVTEKSDYLSIADIAINQANTAPVQMQHDATIEKSNRVLSWLSM